MKIIILGAGQVGTTIAEYLVAEGNDVSIIDQNPKPLRQIQDRLDVRVVTGHGAHPNILRLAGIEDADMLIAVTRSDETNILACEIAYLLFHTPKKIARVRTAAYLEMSELFANDAIPVDVLISPAKLTTEYIAQLIEHPGTLQVIDFAEGYVQLVCVKTESEGPLVNHPIRFVKELIPNIDFRIVTIFRENQAFLPNADTVILPKDEVFFIAAKQDVGKIVRQLKSKSMPNKNIMIAGGGNIGLDLAASLEKHYSVKIIDNSLEVCNAIAEQLNKSLVINGSSVDKELLLEENIDSMDVFCALTNEDEANIISSILAKRLGAKKVMSLVNRSAYVELIQSNDIDIAISPHLNTVSSLLVHIRRGDIVKVQSLRRGEAEAIEVIIHGSQKSSKVIGKSLQEIKLPEGATIGAIVRERKVLIAHHDVIIQPEDHIIVLITNKRKLRQVERLFQADVTFL